MVRIISSVIILFWILLFPSVQLFAQSSALKNIEVLILRGNYSQAARECEKILVHHQQDKIRTRAYYLGGICLLREAKYDQARENLDTILRKYPRSEFADDAALSLADSYLLAGDYSQASQKYEEFLRNFSSSELTNLAQRQLDQSRQGPSSFNAYFSVQVGCFAEKKNAQKLCDELIKRGYEAYLLQLPGEKLSRVRVGKFSTRLEAEFLEHQLKAEGYPTKVCP